MKILCTTNQSASQSIKTFLMCTVVKHRLKASVQTFHGWHEMLRYILTTRKWRRKTPRNQITYVLPENGCKMGRFRSAECPECPTGLNLNVNPKLLTLNLSLNLNPKPVWHSGTWVFTTFVIWASSSPGRFHYDGSRLCQMSLVAVVVSRFRLTACSSCAVLHIASTPSMFFVCSMTLWPCCFSMRPSICF